MSVAYDINKSLSRDSRFKEQDDILLMAIKRAGVAAAFHLSNGRVINGMIRTRYAKWVVVTDGDNDHYVRLPEIIGISVKSDFEEIYEDNDDDNAD